ncbi:MAG: tetratricopeptide repeat protein [Pirellulales bacterium]
MKHRSYQIEFSLPPPPSAAGRRSLRAWLATTLVLLAAIPAMAIATPDERFVAELRVRGLFELAESYCRRRWQDSKLAPEYRIRLAVELARTCADHALASPPAARPALWEEAHQVAAQAEREFADHSRVVLVTLQESLTWLAQGEVAREEARPGGDPQAIDRATEALRRAARTLDRVQSQLETQLRQVRLSQRVDDDALTEPELAALQRNAAYQLGRVFRSQALCYPPESLDRINSLDQAIEQLSPVARLPRADDLVWNCRLEIAACLRLKNTHQQGDQMLRDIVAMEDCPSWVATLAKAESIRLRLDIGQLDEAMQLAAPAPENSGRDSAELEFVRLEAHLAAAEAARQSGDTQRAGSFAQQAAEILRRIDASGSAYWLRRAEVALARASGVPGNDLEALARAAVGLYRGGQLAEALAAYQRAVEEAESVGATDRALELAMTAAAIVHEQGQLMEAAGRYRSAAVSYSAEPMAAQAHLLAIVAAAEQARNASADQHDAQLAQYAALLKEHLQHWPQAHSAGDVRWWLGRLNESQRNWVEAISAYREVPVEHQRFGDAVQTLRGSYRQRLEELRASGMPIERVAQEAIVWFEQVSNVAGQLAGEDAAALRLQSATAAAEFAMAMPDGYGRAQQILSASLSAAGPGAPPEAVAEASSLLVVALAALGRTDEAARLMDGAAGTSLSQQVAMLDALLQLPAGPSQAAERQVGEVALAAVSRIEPRQDELTERDRRMFLRGRAAALAAAGDMDQAIRAYEQAIEHYPADGGLHESLLNLLASAEDSASLRRAVSLARQVEQKSEPRSARWFRARLMQADALCRLGEKPEAAKLIRLTQVLHPELGGPEMKPRFEALLARCQ